MQTLTTRLDTSILNGYNIVKFLIMSFSYTALMQMSLVCLVVR